MSSNHYETLGIPDYSDDSAIKKAYRKLALKYHPDKRASNFTKEEWPAAEEMFKKIASAYEFLSDATQKATYDRQLQHQQAAAAEQKTDARASGAASRRSSHDSSPTSSTSASSGSGYSAKPQPSTQSQHFRSTFFKTAAPAPEFSASSRTAKTRTAAASAAAGTPKAAAAPAAPKSTDTRQTACYFFSSVPSAIKFSMGMSDPRKTHGPVQVYVI